MVLTNFELWAADGGSNVGTSNLPLDFVESNNLHHHNRHLNPFDPRAVTQLNSNLNHLSSNGYYGFSYINSVHDDDNNNNNNISNHNNNNNNNNSTTYNFMANDVNGMNNTQQQQPLLQQQTQATTVNFGSSAYAAGHAVPVARCKKRFFVMNDDDVDAANCTDTNKNYCNNNNNNNYEVSAKRCRFDDDFSAQYCNDFFQLPSTQIATQSCLMDTEEGFENNNNNNNIVKYEQTLNPQLQNLTAQQQLQQQHQQISQQQQMQTQQQQQHQPAQQQHLYHQQQHYQDIIQFATIKCHFNHNNNNNNSCDTLELENNNHTTCKIDLEKNSENILKIHKPKAANNSIQNENGDDDIANDFKIDDATLFAQLHGGCLHHHDHNHQHYHLNSTVSSRGDYTVTNNAVNHHLQDENYYEEF